MRYTFKLLLCGDGGVGKTTLADRYVNGRFKTDTRITVGVQFLVKRLTINGNPIDLQIWDFGGEERFRFLLPAYCRGASGGLFMFDITAPSSLSHIGDWLSVVRRWDKSFPILPVGTKLDLDPYRKVKKEEEVMVVRENNLPDVIEVSAKTGQNVDFAYQAITELMVDHTHPASPTTSALIPT